MGQREVSLLRDEIASNSEHRTPQVGKETKESDIQILKGEGREIDK